LQSVKSLDIEDVLNLNHQIGIDANTIETTAANLKRKLSKKTIPSEAELNRIADKIIFTTKKILAVVKFTTKQNFMAAARVTKDDIISFLKNYLINIYKKHIGNEIELNIEDRINKPFRIEFRPIEITIIIDNLLNNSKKKNATIGIGRAGFILIFVGHWPWAAAMGISDKIFLRRPNVGISTFIANKDPILFPLFS